MKTQNQANAAPLQGMEDISHFTELKPLYQALQKQNDILTLTKQIDHMISDVQLHRGMSMSLLAGSEIFKRDIEQLQRQLGRRLTALEIIAHNTGGLLSDRDKENLHNGWTTIRHNWHDDRLVDNFELHSHFIEQLLNLVNSLAQTLIDSLGECQPTNINSGNNAVYPRSFKEIEVINFIARQMPQMIELIAKIRGLSSQATSVGTVEYTEDRKLRYLIACAREQHEKLRHQSERLKTLTEDLVPALSHISEFEMKLLRLFDLVERDILGGTTMTTGTHQIFKLASDIMAAYSTIIDQGWGLIRHWLELDIESWIVQKVVD